MFDAMPLRTLRSALVSMAAVLLSFGVMYAACLWSGVNASPAILAAALSMGLMRRHEHLGIRALLLKFLMLPLIAVAAGLVGFAFLHVPLLGAVLFTGGMTLSILLRKYGARANAIGRLIALPLISIFVAPVHIDVSHGGPALVFLMIAAGMIAFASTVVVDWLAARLGVAEEPEPEAAVRVRPTREGELHIATRMALQMLTALGLAFAIGMLVFPAHWFWVVLTAFIVCSGAVGRGDAIHKGLLRLGGAIGGALVAALVGHIAFPDPAVYAGSVFLVLFLGIWLRQINYAYWAACATLIFALLQGTQGVEMVPLLGLRVLCIVIGALCAVAATWFVYPIRTEQLVRRRVADALGALRDALASKPEDPEHGARFAALGRHADELKRVAPPVQLHRKVFGAKDPDTHPATWIDLMHGLLAQARTPGFDRAELGAEMRRLGGMLKAKSEAPAANGKSGE